MRTHLARWFPPSIVPVALVLLVWWTAVTTSEIPSYKLPTPGSVLSTGLDLITSGRLLEAALASLGRLAVGFVIGAILGLVVGLAISRVAWVARFLEPLVIFFQSIAGVVWIPLAIVWFGLGTGPVLFVVANMVFFIVLYNTMLGVQSIPERLHDVVRTLGASRLDVLREVIVPGALSNVLVGLRGGLAFGWRALVAAELIAANSGLGFLGLQASKRFESATVVVVIIAIGTIWLLIERLVLVPIENRTVVRWGMASATARN